MEKHLRFPVPIPDGSRVSSECIALNGNCTATASVWAEVIVFLLLCFRCFVNSDLTPDDR